MGLWVWSVSMVLVGTFGILVEAYEALDKPLEQFIPVIIRYGIWGSVWGTAVSRSAQRQGFRPRWFWIASGAVAGILAVVPVWHHGREWKSRWRKVVGWTIFVIFAAVLTGFFWKSFFES